MVLAYKASCIPGVIPDFTSGFVAGSYQHASGTLSAGVIPDFTSGFVAG